MLHIKYFPGAYHRVCSCFISLSCVPSSGMHKQSHPSWCRVRNFSGPSCLAWSKQLGVKDHWVLFNSHLMAMFSATGSAFTRKVMGLKVTILLRNMHSLRASYVWGTIKTAIAPNNKRCHSLKREFVSGTMFYLLRNIKATSILSWSWLCSFLLFFFQVNYFPITNLAPEITYISLQCAVLWCKDVIHKFT